MDDLNDALDNLAKNSRNAAGTRVSARRGVAINAGGNVTLVHGGGGPGGPRRPHAVRRWLDRWVIAPAAAGAGVTMAIFFVWTVLDVSTALEAGYSVPELLLSPAGTTPGHEAFSTSLAVGGPVGVVAGWAWAFLKG